MALRIVYGAVFFSISCACSMSSTLFSTRFSTSPADDRFGPPILGFDFSIPFVMIG
ncbi:hypothetical protein SLEP1_g57910 [Rubroshorea leprosula]|uniref:Uncharacterized protein n=1 Tax=Rubroshorea leprosula TaxID=152421 RepID=A0AAV5MQX4_9ROSI|nr:hypothetical protein SLEP1_g57910 [Rubroshorea leprosula]